MRWLGNAQSRFGWRGRISQLGVAVVSILILIGAAENGACWTRAVLKAPQSVEEHQQLMEWRKQWYLSQTDKPYPWTKEQSEAISTGSITWTLGFGFLAVAFESVLGLSILFIRAWGRILLLVTLWGILALSGGGYLYNYLSYVDAPGHGQRLLLDFIRGYWCLGVLIFFFNWIPVKEIFNRP